MLVLYLHAACEIVSNSNFASRYLWRIHLVGDKSLDRVIDVQLHTPVTGLALV